MSVQSDTAAICVIPLGVPQNLGLVVKTLDPNLRDPLTLPEGPRSDVAGR